MKKELLISYKNTNDISLENEKLVVDTPDDFFEKPGSERNEFAKEQVSKEKGIEKGNIEIVSILGSM